MASDLLTSADLAHFFGKDITTISRWARAGNIPAVRDPGGQWRFRRSDVEKFMADFEPEPAA